MTDQQLEPFLQIANLIFAGDAASLLKTGDVCPLPKDVVLSLSSILFSKWWTRKSGDDS